MNFDGDTLTGDASQVSIEGVESSLRSLLILDLECHVWDVPCAHPVGVCCAQSVLLFFTSCNTSRLLLGPFVK